MKEMLLGFFIAFISLFLLIMINLPKFFTGFEIQLMYFAFGAVILAVFGRVVGWV